MVNYYRDMWPQRLHLLVLGPLSSLTSTKAKCNWTSECQNAFEVMKRLIAKETLHTYPNFKKPIEIHTDASKVQLGIYACISQEESPAAFYITKVNPAQTRYTTTEQESLSIIKTLKELRSILLGQQIVVHTDHANLTYKHFNLDRVMRWKLFIEEYSPDLQYIKVEKNVVADALSLLPQQSISYQDSLHSFYSIVECHKSDQKKTLPHDFYPLSYVHLETAQKRDPQLTKELLQKNSKHQLKDFHGGGTSKSLICYNNKKVLPKHLQKHVTDGIM
jgi:hypothetical protein